jgi:hypothetical protein
MYIIFILLIVIYPARLLRSTHVSTVMLSPKNNIVSIKMPALIVDVYISSQNNLLFTVIYESGELKTIPSCTNYWCRYSDSLRYLTIINLAGKNNTITISISVYENISN